MKTTVGFQEKNNFKTNQCIEIELTLFWKDQEHTNKLLKLPTCRDCIAIVFYPLFTWFTLTSKTLTLTDARLVLFYHSNHD